MLFKDRVYQVVSQIPAGKVATYKMVAKLAGSCNSARAVGTLMKKNPNPFFKKSNSFLPCHRVVLSSGRLGEYSGGVNLKKKLLVKEGVVMEGDKVQTVSFWKK